jgi:hypothetical protein
MASPERQLADIANPPTVWHGNTPMLHSCTGVHMMKGK